MESEIIVIGGGASGLMAACAAAGTLFKGGDCARVTVLEKMSRPARKLMVTGKGRCNFTNVKPWDAFSRHIRTNPRFLRPAFMSFRPEDVIDFFESRGLRTVVERGDRAFPQSYRAVDVVDTLYGAAKRLGVNVVPDSAVTAVTEGRRSGEFLVTLGNGAEWTCRRLIISTGGLSYPSTGSTGDGYAWAEGFGHTIVPCFPALTALVPSGYKVGGGRGHIDRSVELTDKGKALCGASVRNVSLTALVNGIPSGTEFGDIEFTDGGIEGPLGFQVSRTCVKSMINGSRVSLVVDLKPAVRLEELKGRVKSLWEEISADPRSRTMSGKERYRVLLGKLMPWDLIPGFRGCNPGLLTAAGRSSKDVRVDLDGLAEALKAWRFDIDGYVGYERCVVTAGGVSTDEVFQKTMESRLREGLYFCGEVLDIDADTGGYNLQLAFSTGNLAGRSAAASLLDGAGA